MTIQSVELTDFRNYEHQKVELSPGTNIFYGDNAQGKTNFLEAVYISGTTRSHKGTRDRDLIRFGCESAHIVTDVKKKDAEYRIDLHLRKNQPKVLSVNHQTVHRASEIFGILNLIFFSPEDLNLIKNGPSERRRFLDSELCQLDRVYLEELKTYRKVLNERNQLLKDLYSHPDLSDTLEVWDEQLLRYGSAVIERRRKFSEELSGIASSIHEKLTKGKELLEISYEPDVSAESFSKELRRNRSRDIHLGQTTTGPHRDDLKVTVNEVDMRKFGSQGQQRTCALSMKLSEIQLVENKIHEKPVLMLDDVLSELDRQRQQDLLSEIGEIQTLITCTGMDDLIRDRVNMDRVFHVQNGTVEVLPPEMK